MIGINTGLISTEVVPIGGVKQLGLGHERSKFGIDDYMDVHICAWEFDHAQRSPILQSALTAADGASNIGASLRDTAVKP